MAKLAPSLLVVGSLNIDYLASVSTLPAAGQTINALGLVRRFGGKGANQAVAAARQGSQVSMIGCLGQDADGRAYRERLKTEGVDVQGIVFTDRALTGTALIAVDSKGENTIIVAAGANGHLTPSIIEAQKARIRRAKVILLQFEVPLKTTLSVIRHANQATIPVVLNPSPYCEGFPWGKHRVDTLIVNSGEAETVFGLSPEHLVASRSSWVKALADAGIANLVVTRGRRSTLFLNANDCFEVPTLAVTPKDTVGAGDAFAGTFASRRAEGLDTFSAIQLANCAGALTTLKSGAQEAMPNRSASEKALRRLPGRGFK